MLYVDDEPDFADLIATMLEREDDRFAVETEAAAADGLDRLHDSEFDCVVSDYDMPETNGIELLAHRIRNAVSVDRRRLAGSPDQIP